MLWKIIIIIWMIITALDFILTKLISKIATQNFKIKYPDKKLYKTITMKIYGHIAALLMSAIPIYNIFMLLFFIFRFEYLLDESINKMLEKSIPNE